MKEFLERAARATGFTAQQFHIILDALPVPLSWASLSDGKISFTNRAFTTTFGYEEKSFETVDDWIDKTYRRERDRERARTYWQDLWQMHEHGISEIAPFEIEVLCRNGAIKTVEHCGVLLHEMGLGIAIFNDVSDRRIAEQALRQSAFEDIMTKLANRRMLQERWDQLAQSEAAQGTMTGILLIDLDGFKAVNDRWGHEAGDQTLITVATRLRDSVRAGDLVCRMGGDEFAVLLPDIRTPETAEQVCSRIAAALSLPINLGTNSVSIGASIGASLLPQDGTDLKTLLRCADQALYRRKALNKGGWEWFVKPEAA
ncbi:sensor domain-containing diguanylate cyclase [Brucella sp. BE17]|uniref:sensor domain-containing diguanylate cyclase n=1 Tax=Brucella sp. BE17 TaxID=3142977 RepID=UPI0031BB5AB7